MISKHDFQKVSSTCLESRQKTGINSKYNRMYLLFLDVDIHFIVPTLNKILWWIFEPPRKQQNEFLLNKRAI